MPQAADGVDRVGVGGGLVLPVALQPGEAQGHAAGVAGRGLHAVEGDLDDDLGPDEHGDPLPTGLELQEPPGLPLEQLVGEALEDMPE